MLLISVSALTVHAAAPFAPYNPPAVYDGVRETSEYLRSFDGTRLAITIRRPTKSGQVATEAMPVIVTQDRSMSGPDASNRIRYFTDRGYVWVAQDRRGTGASFGVQTGFVNGLDVKDAKAVIEWAGAQSFSNGKVVAFGCSNQGAWQYLVAPLDPKYLVAIVPACASPQFFDHAVTVNGVPIFPAGEKHYAGECNRPPSGARPAGFVPPPPRAVDADVDGALLKAALDEQKCGASMLGQYWMNMPRDGLNTFANYRPAIEDTAITSHRQDEEFGRCDLANRRLVRRGRRRPVRRTAAMGWTLDHGPLGPWQSSRPGRKARQFRSRSQCGNVALVRLPCQRNSQWRRAACDHLLHVERACRARVAPGCNLATGRPPQDASVFHRARTLAAKVGGRRRQGRVSA